ncbi:MAG: glycoside hydrolase family 3 protein [Aristaeellaceae bacterium]
MSEGKWQRIRFMPGSPLEGREQRVTGCEAHRALSRRAACEGMVLLKNEDDFLPLGGGQRIAMFGKAQADYVKGGGGSGDVTCAYIRSILEGLEDKEAQGRVRLFAPLSEYYRADVARQYAESKHPGQTVEPALPEALLMQARAWTDTALITVCRFSGEGYDRTGEAFDGDYFLSREEAALVERVTAAFPRVAVVLNTGGMMDTTWFKDNPRIQAALLAWQAGMEGGLATADVLCGDVCPSGHLNDTFAVDFAAYPSSEGFNESEEYVTYEDDIFVGYRYFETIPGAAEKVCYPFGFGLSYTTFALGEAAVSVHGDNIRVTVPVTNTGRVAGREVAQVYCEAPQGRLGKAARVLVGFAKTRLLNPGETETVSIAFTPYQFASYDDEGRVCASAYVLEAGEYRFHVGDNVRDARPAVFVYTVETDRVLEQLSPRCVPTSLPRRLRADGSYTPVPGCGPAPERVIADNLPYDGQQPVEWDGPVPGWWDELPFPSLKDVYEGRATLDEFIDALTDKELVHLLGGQPGRGVANTGGFGNLPSRGVPNVMTADGPAGLRIEKICGVNTTAFPCATLLACTWDPEIVFEVGYAGAEEVRENGFGVWLTPAINIHRSPLCGRNFEYYSEDPLLAGKMAAAMIRGIQSMGVAASLKHFACNNKETNRRECDSRLSERALREIYLKAFEICVKEASPWTIMSSYNLVNGLRASENRDLLTGILREEWGFDGAVTTDWFTHGSQYTEIAAGNDIKMACGMPEHTLQMLQEGRLSREDVKASVRRVLRMILRLA